MKLYELVERHGMLTMTIKGQIRLHTGTQVLVADDADMQHTPGVWKEAPEGASPKIPDKLSPNRIAYRLKEIKGRRNVGKMIRWDQDPITEQIFVAGHVVVMPGTIIIVDDLAKMDRTSGTWEHVAGELPVIEQFVDPDPFKGVTSAPGEVIVAEKQVEGLTTTTRTLSKEEPPLEKDEPPPGMVDVGTADASTRTMRRR